MQKQDLITFLKGDKVDSTTDYADALPVNMYAVVRPIFNAAGYMIQEQGLTYFGSGLGIDRGGFWNDKQQKHFRVTGGDLVEVSSSGVSTSLGSVSGTDTAVLDCSFNTQAVLADGKFWLYDPANGFRQVTDPDLGTPIDFCWVDGYYFFTDGSYIFHTDINNESSIDPLKFATAEFIPDYTYGVMKTEDDKVMVFGRYSIEYFYNAANANFAFTRIPGRSLKIGICGTHCKTEVKGNVYILGNRKNEAVSLHLIGAGQTQKVGTRQVDKILAQYTDAQLQDVAIESYEDDGTSFIAIHLPDMVLKFNETVASSVGVDNAWSVSKSDIAGDTPWRAKFGVYDRSINKYVFGDKQGPFLGYLDASTATQYDNAVECLLFTPLMYLKEQSLDELEIMTIPGFTDYRDANVFVSLTYDGVTYGKEWSIMYGLPSDYGAKFILNRLGFVEFYFGFKLRAACKSRLAFSQGLLTHG